MGLFSKKPKSVTLPQPMGTSEDPYARALRTNYEQMIEPDVQGQRRGVLRLVTGGPLALNPAYRCCFVEVG